jgi:hypothetical protein
MAYYRSSKLCACRSQLHTIEGGGKLNRRKNLITNLVKKLKAKEEKNPNVDLHNFSPIGQNFIWVREEKNPSANL